MPLPATWRSWLNWIGCSRATFACVIHGDRLTSADNQRRPTTKKRAPNMLNRAIVLALRWKICDIESTRAAQPADSQSLPRLVARAPRTTPQLRWLPRRFAGINSAHEADPRPGRAGARVHAGARATAIHLSGADRSGFHDP